MRARASDLLIRSLSDSRPMTRTSDLVRVRARASGELLTEGSEAGDEGVAARAPSNLAEREEDDLSDGQGEDEGEGEGEGEGGCNLARQEDDDP